MTETTEEKKKVPTKADIQAENKELLAQIAALTSEKETPKPSEDKVTVECICANVHLGNGVVIRATRNSKNGNWKNGDRAEVAPGLADLLVENEQCKVV